MIDKICINCKHIWMYFGSPEYSEWTPGDDWSFSCLKNHFEISGDNISDDKYRDTINKAKQCSQFEPYKIEE